MPRRPDQSVDLGALSSPLAPVLGGRGANLSIAMQALTTTMTSATVREWLIEESRFPLAGDMPAFLVVNQLIYRTTARPTDLADAIGTGRSNVSKIVRRLEHAGLVGRMPDPTDGRQSVIGLTRAGRDVAGRIVDALSGTYDVVFESWSDAEFEQLEELVVRLARDIDERMDHAVERLAGVRLPAPAARTAATHPAS